MKGKILLLTSSLFVVLILGVWEVEAVGSGEIVKTDVLRDNELNSRTPDTALVDADGMSTSTPSVTITSPNGGETYPMNSTQVLKWTTTGNLNRIVTYLTNVKGEILATHLSNERINTGELSWRVPDSFPLGDYRVKILACYSPEGIDCNSDEDLLNASVSDLSEMFSIAPEITKSVTITSPNGGEEWTKGTVMPIEWSTSGQERVGVFAQRCNPGQDASYCASMNVNFLIKTIEFDTGRFLWTVGEDDIQGSSGLSVGTYIISIRDPDTLDLFDHSDAYFSLVDTDKPYITVTQPNGGEVWRVGSSVAIQWVGPGLDSSRNFGIDILNEDESMYKKDIVTDQEKTSFVWTVSSDMQPGLYKIRVYSPEPGVSPEDEGYYDISDISDGSLRVEVTSGEKITPAVTVTYPNGGEKIKIGDQWPKITWKRNWLPKNSSGQATISIQKKDGERLFLTSGASDVAGFEATVPTWLSPGEYKIIVTSDGSAEHFSDESDNYFTVEKADAAKEVIDVKQKKKHLIKSPDSPDVYVIEDGKKTKVKDPQEFQREGYKWEDIQDIQSDLLMQIQELKAEIKQLKKDINLLRATNDDKVYRVIEGKKLWIPSQEAFTKQSLDWSEVEETASTAIEQYPTANLIRVKGDPKVYSITPNGFKKWIRTAEVFNSYSSNRWQDIVEVDADVAESFDEVELMRVSGDPKVYKVEGGIIRWIKSAQVFETLNLDWNRIVEVNYIELGVYEEGEEISS